MLNAINVSVEIDGPNVEAFEAELKIRNIVFERRIKSRVIDCTHYYTQMKDIEPLLSESQHEMHDYYLNIIEKYLIEHANLSEVSDFFADGSGLTIFYEQNIKIYELIDLSAKVIQLLAKSKLGVEYYISNVDECML